MGDAYPQRKQLPHQAPDWVTDGSYFLVTINCATRGENTLCRPPIGDRLLAAAECYHLRLTWHCRIFLLMPDHLHAIVSVPLTPGLESTIKSLKKYLARTLRLEWQRDFFDHRLRTPDQLVEKVSYVRMNPVRKGLCGRAEEWPWVYAPSDRRPTAWG